MSYEEDVDQLSMTDNQVFRNVTYYDEDGCEYMQTETDPVEVMKKLIMPNWGIIQANLIGLPDDL